MTWGGTAVGAFCVFLFPTKGKKTVLFLDASLGFAAGMMLGASFLSMLLTALESTEESWKEWRWVPCSIGFGLGCLFVYLGTLIVGKVIGEGHDAQLELMAGRELDTGSHRSRSSTKASLASQADSGIFVSKKSFRRIIALCLAITIHNIPEGLVVGVGFSSGDVVTGGTVTLAIALQNFPEGLAVAMPLVASGMHKLKAAFWGQASGLVEPLFGIIAVAIVGAIESLLPYALSFSAGCMVYVVLDDIIPDANERGNGTLAANFAGVGFILMMALEIGFEGLMSG